MPKLRKDVTPVKRRGAPAMTLEARENQLISLAVDLAEKQLSEGTASSQVITHYLKLGSTMEKLEKEKLIKENELLQAKTESMLSSKKVEEMFTEAISAFKRYSGNPDTSDDTEDI
jgi:hypothetical protein